MTESKYCLGGLTPDDIVITGFSGRFPQSKSIEEFKEKLYNSCDFFEGHRWIPGAFGMSTRGSPLIPDIDKFDNGFFGIVGQTAKIMSPEQRMLIEVSYEAIADSGYDPKDFRGKKVSAYNATVASDLECIATEEEDPQSLQLQSLRSLNIGRVSYALDFKGPNGVIDTACSSSLAVLDVAISDLLLGKCEAALVNCNQINLLPQRNYSYFRLGIFSKSGNCVPFSSEADGMVRGECIGAMFLQKASAARRVYAKVAALTHVGSGFAPEGITVPSFSAMTRIFKENLKKAEVNHFDVTYIEAHGTGTSVGDPIECNAVTNVYCEGRKKTLLMGSVKSNIGHTEAASAFSGVVKCIFAMETGIIAPNYKFKLPNPVCTSLIDGRISIPKETATYDGGIIAVNSMGIGGSVGQILLEKNPVEISKENIEQNESLPISHSIPQIILCCARREDGVEYALQKVRDLKPNPEFFALYHSLAFSSLNEKPYRGYTIMSENGTTIKPLSAKKREVWYILTGMGCQYKGMGNDLMVIDVFANSMRRSAKTLESYGFDLFDIINPSNDHFSTHRRIVPSFVGICAVQIALIDVLKEVGITPDGIVGHSTGEIACAYADGCCTAEETILLAYYRGMAIENTELPAGEMAAVGMAWEEVKKRCPRGVYAACHNAVDSVTISGLSEPLEMFTEELKKDNVFVRHVDAYGWGFHSELIGAASPLMKSNLQKVLRAPKQRSKLWRSTAYPPDQWHEEKSKMADADYFTHNLISAVRFAEATALIPSDAITIEIAPHPLLRAILKRQIGADAAFIGLMKRKENNVTNILSGIGELYVLGLNPQVQKLYPTVNYPVPRGTPMIADLIKWDHSKSFHSLEYKEMRLGGVYNIKFSPNEEEKYLMDHRIDGKSLFPATGYIVSAWRCFAKCQDLKSHQVAIVIEDFKIHRASILNKSDLKEFVVSITNGEGFFDIAEGKSTVASGRISNNDKMITVDDEIEFPDDPDSFIGSREIYDDLKPRGYQYGPAFRCLDSIHINGTLSYLRWEENWITYLDAHLLLFGLIDECNVLSYPTGALSIKINPLQFSEYIEKLSSTDKRVPVFFNKDTMVCSSPGVEIKGLKLEAGSRHDTFEKPVLEKCEFIPHRIESPSLISDKLGVMYDDYDQACAVEARNIMLLRKDSSFSHNDSDQFEIEKYVIPNVKNNDILLLTLVELSKCIKERTASQKMKEKLLGNYMENIRIDLIYKSLFHECHLRILLDIIHENVGEKLSVVELCYDNSPITGSLSEMAMKIANVTLTGTIFHPFPESIDASVISSKSIEVKSFSDIDSIESKKPNVIISYFLFGSEFDLRSNLRKLSDIKSNRSFVIFYHRENTTPHENLIFSICNKTLETQSSLTLEKILVEENLVVITKFSGVYGSNLYLLRYIDDNIEQQKNVVIKVGTSNYESWVEPVKNAMNESYKTSSRLWLVSDNCPYNGLIGFVKCLRNEPGGKNVRCVFLISDETNSNPPPFHFHDPFYAPILKKDLVYNVFHKCWGSFRHLTLDNALLEKMVPHSYLDIGTHGDLSSFKWFEAQGIESKKDIVHVVYSALNFKDVMFATGKLSTAAARDDVGNDRCVIGLEFSGIRPNGQRVMGFCSNRGIATTVANATMTCDVPDHWTLQDAATVPVVYATCFYALIIKGQLSEGESVLIHSGAGGIGIAAIRLALSLRCEIFTTVGTPDKVDYLKRLFPELKHENIGNSRNTSFEKMIQVQTNKRGVDLILNSLADDKLLASTRCLAEGGRFIEIGKYDLMLDSKIGLGMFLKGTTFHGVALGKGVKKADWQMIMRLLQDGIEMGVVQPLDRTVFSINQTEQAFRFMTTGNHTGKVLLEIRHEPQLGETPETSPRLAQCQSFFYVNKVYIVIGGLGGFGMAVVRWLILKGVEKIIITSRHGVRNGYQKLQLSRWKRMGAQVSVSMLNVGRIEEAERLIHWALSVGPVGGIFNSAVVLHDAFWENLDSDSFREVCLPKAEATLYLDDLTRRYCTSLDYFVCFSSISCGKGNAGQTNYGFANSVMERICERRRQDNLPGLAIQWGIIGDAGVVHRSMGDDAIIAGVKAQPLESCLETLDKFLSLNCPVVSSYMNANIQVEQEQNDDVLSIIAKAIGYADIMDIDLTKSFGELGIDSIAGIEILQALEYHYGLTMTSKEMQMITVNELKGKIEALDITSSAQKGSTAMITFKLNPYVVFPDVSTIRLDNNNRGIPVLFVHYSALYMDIFKKIASRLENPCYVLIIRSEDAETKDMETITKFYLEDIHCSGVNKAHIVSYSDAATLAFEMVARAETSDKLKILSVCFLNGSMHLAKALTYDHSNTDSTKLELESLSEFLKSISCSDEFDKVKHELEQRFRHEQFRCLAQICSFDDNDNIGEFIGIAKKWVHFRNLMRSCSFGKKCNKDLVTFEAKDTLLANDVAFVRSEFEKVFHGDIVIHRLSSDANTCFSIQPDGEVANELRVYYRKYQ